MEQRVEQQKALNDLHAAANSVSKALESLMNRLVAGSIQVCENASSLKYGQNRIKQKEGEL
ncbi:unnamed protein product [Hymenolepis diminuta]|uniref:V-SNARE coiled-coil homology domain-containing protein n=1 Tax=Hymenolepis diminuta TaxID=6216 RepID=A0A0R3SP74_HYMDI|nr:unnamed protein product [Hymenolepis diminuta]